MFLTGITRSESETLKCEPRNAKRSQNVEKRDTIISILNEMVDAVNKFTSEADLNYIYKVILEFMQDLQDSEILHLQNLLKKLQEKVQFYAKLQGQNQLKILVNFVEFLYRINKKCMELNVQKDFFV